VKTRFIYLLMKKQKTMALEGSICANKEHYKMMKNPLLETTKIK